MQHSWTTYLAPSLDSWAQRSKRSSLSGASGVSPRNVVSSLSTLWTMGLWDELEYAKRWVESHLLGTASDVQHQRLPHLTEPELAPILYNDYVGGLLSAYALTNHSAFRDQAVRLAQMMRFHFVIAYYLQSEFAWVECKC